MDTSVSFNMGDLIRIQEVGFHTVRTVYTHPDRILDWNVFIYVANGKMQVWEETDNYVLTSGQYLFLKSGLHHWGEPETTAGTCWYWIHFYNTAGLFQCTEFNHYMSSIKVIPYEEYNKYLRLPKYGSVLKTRLMENKLDAMNRLFHSADPFRTIALSIQVTELFLNIYKDVNSIGSISRVDRTVERVIRYLENKRIFPLSSREIEDCLSMNYAYLCKVFKVKTGITIHEYNTQVFVNRAVTMMRETSHNISEISDQLGFGSPFYFSRVFKANVGCSPSDYCNKICREGMYEEKHLR